MNFLRLLHVNSMNSRYRITFRGACSPLADNIWLNVLEKSLCSEVTIKDYAVIGDSWVRPIGGGLRVVPQALDILQTDVNLRAEGLMTTARAIQLADLDGRITRPRSFSWTMPGTALKTLLRTGVFSTEEEIMVMRSVKSSVKGWKAAAACLAVVIAIVVQALGLGAGWAQEPAEPRLDEEIAKQEKIFQRRGADVPSGYITNRGLPNYAELLPTGFCDALGRLGSSDRWLDIGAGDGQAILDYYASEGDAPSGEKCARPGDKARAVAMSIEDRRTDQWRERAASLGGDRLRYLSGKRLRQYSGEELGKFQIITDVFGGFTYTENLSQFVEKVLSLLEVGGIFYTLVPGVHLEDGKDKLGVLYLTELENAAGRPEKVCSWLKRSAGVRVTCESKSDWKRPTELIKVEKVFNDVSVPRMKLLEFGAGYPPDRRFQLEP